VRSINEFKRDEFGLGFGNGSVSHNQGNVPRILGLSIVEFVNSVDIVQIQQTAGEKCRER
jgi:hypothetical protein